MIAATKTIIPITFHLNSSRCCCFAISGNQPHIRLTLLCKSRKQLPLTIDYTETTFHNDGSRCEIESASHNQAASVNGYPSDSWQIPIWLPPCSSVNLRSKRHWRTVRLPPSSRYRTGSVGSPPSVSVILSVKICAALLNLFLSSVVTHGNLFPSNSKPRIVKPRQRLSSIVTNETASRFRAELICQRGFHESEDISPTTAAYNER